MSSAAGNPSSESAAEPASSKIIKLKTSDGAIFELEEAVAMELATVRSFLEETDGSRGSADALPLSNVSSMCLPEIIRYCKQQVAFAARSASEEEKKKYGADFVKEHKPEELKELILGANYLNVKQLLELLCQAVADHIQNKSVEYVRSYFGIEKDFTPEEEERLRRENEWAFEGVDQD